MRRFFLGLVLVLLFLELKAETKTAPIRKDYVPVLGPSLHIFDQSAGEKRKWYINDHCLIQGPDQRYHLFGITHTQEIIPPSWAEHTFAHASSEELLKVPWQKHPRVLNVNKKLGETHLWAPHIIEKDGIYYMFYAGGGNPWKSMINLALSKDLFNWEQYSNNPLFRDFYEARDPMVFKYQGEYLMYYCKTYAKDDFRSTVALRRSRDLIHWSEPEFALVLSDYPRLINSGHTESPYLFEYNGRFYLAVCTPFYHYRLTRVFISDTPYRFEEKDEITSLIAHCAEVLNFKGNWYLSHGGWFYDGVYLAQVNWKPIKKFEPRFLFLNSGESQDYLVSKERASVGVSGFRSRAPGNKLIKIKKGGRVHYRIPIPKGLNTLQLLICGQGDYEILVNGKKLESEKDPSSSEGLDLYWLKAQDFSDTHLELEVINPGPSAEYLLNFIRIYFID